MTGNTQAQRTLLDRLDQALTRSSRWLPALFLAAFLLKLLYVLQSSGALHVTVPIMDSEYYDRMARGIAEGRIIHDEAFFMGPLYPFVLAGIYSTLGTSITIVRILQVAAGALSVVLTYLVGRHVFRPSVALGGAVMLLLYGASTFYEGQLLMMWLGTLINMVTLYVLHRFRDRNGVGKYVLAGSLIGLSALARANIVVFLLVVLAWIVFLSKETRRLLAITALLGSFVVFILPVTIHNYLASRDFVPITSNGGMNFYIGNSGDATGIFYPPKGINIVTDDAIKKYVERHLGRELKPSQHSRYWYGEAFDFIRSHPLREIKLLLRKTALLLNGYEVPQIESFEIARDQYGTLRMLFVGAWGMLSLGIFGGICLRREWKRLYFLYGYALALSLSIVLFFVASRYRVQIAPVICLFAAHALLVDLPDAMRGIRREISPIILFVVIVLGTHPALFALPVEDVRWREHCHEAYRWSKIGEYERALAEIDRAIEIHPNYAESYVQRAMIHKAHGNRFKAIDDYSRAIDIDPSRYTIHYDLAQALRQLKMYRPAIESYLKAIELNPLMLEAYNNLGIAYREVEDYENSVRYFEKVIEMDPRYAKAYNNLGASLAETGDLDGAIRAFEGAIEADPDYSSTYKNLAMAYVQKQRIQDAIDMLETYLRFVPGDSQAGEIFEKLRVVVEADTLR